MAETGDLFGMLLQALLQNDAVAEQAADLKSLCLGGAKAEIEDERGALLLEHVLALLSHQTVAPTESESIDLAELDTLPNIVVSTPTMPQAGNDAGVEQVDTTTLPDSTVTEWAINGDYSESLAENVTSGGAVSMPEAVRAVSSLYAVPRVVPQSLAATPAATRAHAALSEALPQAARRPTLTGDSGLTLQSTEGIPVGRGPFFYPLAPISSPSAAILRAEILSFSQVPGRGNIELVVTPAGYGRVIVSAHEHPDNRVTVRLVVENTQVKEAITAQISRLINISGNVTVEISTRAEAQEAESGKNDGRSRGGQDQQRQRQGRNEIEFEMQGVNDASR